MSSRNTKQNKGYVFAGLFDICLYGALSLIFPVMSLIVYFCENPVLGMDTIYDALFSEFLVVATLFYDFYCRYRDCEDQTKWVVSVLDNGRILFFFATIIVLILMYFASKELYIEDIGKALYVIVLTCIYPVFICFFDAIKRIKNERNRKISKN